MELDQTLLDQITQSILDIDNGYKKSNENKKVYLIEINPESYKILKKDIEDIINKPMKKLERLLDCKIVLVKDLEVNFKII
jgi:tRNA G37 N-methylase Trm5